MKNKMPVNQMYVPFSGGLDLTTPNIEAKSGTIRDSKNVYQGENGGYYTMEGYECFDGKTLPSAAQHSTLPATITGAIAVGNTLTDGVHTGYVLYVASDHIVLTNTSGSFSTGNILVGATVVGTCIGPQIINGGTTARLRAYYHSLAEDYHRTTIIAVPGSGDVLGVWYYSGKWYAFRNNAGGTQADMYVESTNGWTQVALGYEVFFDSGGTYEPLETQTITGAVSGATAVLTRVELESGSWAAGTAKGKFIFSAKTGTFQLENVNVGANLNVATLISTVNANIGGSVSGKYEFGNYNFTGNSRTKRMYGVNGKNRAFEFDGTVFLRINTYMSTDAPSHLYESNSSLYLSFLSSIQKSSPGFPYQWSVVVGASEMAMGDDVTGFMSQPGDGTDEVLTVFSKNRTSNIYSDKITTYKTEVGAVERSIQRIGSTFFLSDFGIMSLDSSQSYGNFEDAVISSKISPWLSLRKNLVTASCIVREKNQYWLFFSDKSALCCTINNGKISAMCPMYLKHKVTCIASVEDDSGKEVIMFGSDDGKVRKLFSGKSFDGEAIDWYAELCYDHLKSATTNKKFRKGIFEVKGDSYAEFSASYSLGYGSSEISQSAATLKELNMLAEYWDSFTWDAFTWDGRNLMPSILDMTGTGENISVIIRGNSKFSGQLKFSGVLLKFSPTRGKVYNSQE